MKLQEIRAQLLNGVPLSKIKLRATYYGRVSTIQDVQIISLNNQETFFRHMILENPNWTFIEGYIDEGITGTSDVKRTNFMKMIDESRKDKFDLIITKEISRFSRNTLDSIKYTRELLNNGVAVLFLNDNINTIYPDSELRLTIMSSMAQDEIRRLSERVKFGVAMAIKKGTLLGNNKLYGYTKKKNRLYVNKKEAAVIKEIYELYGIQNKSTTYIRDYLNSKDISTNYDKKWSTTTILRILKNPKYKGFYCGNKSFTENYMSKKIKYLPSSEWVLYKSLKQIPEIIPECLWEKVQNKLINHSKHIKKNKSVYTNKLTCYRHNAPLYQRHNKYDTVWICSHHLTHKDNKCFINIPEKHLNIILDDIIKKIPINYKAIEKQLFKLYKRVIEVPKIDLKEQILSHMLITKDLSTTLSIKLMLERNIANKIKNKTFEFQTSEKTYYYKIEILE